MTAVTPPARPRPTAIPVSALPLGVAGLGLIGVVGWLLWAVLGTLGASIAGGLAFVAGVAGFRAYAGKRRAAYLNSLSEEERLETEYRLKAELEDRKFFTAVHREALRLKQVIPVHLGRLGQQHMERIDQNTGNVKRRKIRRIRFKAVWYTRTEIWFRIDGKHLPYGVSYYDLMNKQELSFDLTRAIRRECRFFEDDDYFVWLRVSLKNGYMGVPKRVEWARIYHDLPASNPFSVAVGVNEYGKLITQDIRRWPHGVIAGATFQGKSVMLVQWLITLIKRNGPDDLQFVLVDLKDGVELSAFADLPHTRAFVQEPSQVLEELETIWREYKRRMALYQGVCRDIRGWNKQRPSAKQPYIFLVVDELADLMDEKKYRDKNEPILKHLARKGRAAGIHLILATQILEARVLTMQIRGNLPGRICFSVPGYDESRLVIGNGMAKGLEPPGRCIYRAGSKHLILQAPIASEKDIQATLEAARGDVKKDQGVDPAITLFNLALANYGGACNWRELWDGSDRLLGQHKIKALLKDYEYDPDDPKIIKLDNGRYILSPSFQTPQGKSGRYLVPINGSLPSLVEVEDQILGQGARGYNAPELCATQKDDPLPPFEAEEDEYDDLDLLPEDYDLDDLEFTEEELENYDKEDW